MGESGAFKALMLDHCEEIGLALPAIDDTNAPELRATLPAFVGVSNPLDITAQGLVEPDLYERTLTSLLHDDRFGSVVACIIQTDPVTSGIKLPPILKAVENSTSQKPLIFAGLDEGAPFPAEYIERLRAHGIPYFPSTERAFRALKRIGDFAKRDFTPASGQQLTDIGISTVEGVIPEYRAKELLAPCGIPFPKGRFVTSLDEALAVAQEVGYPLVLKAQSADLSHKSDAGGVILKLADAEALKEGWQRLQGNIAHHRPGLVLDGVLLEHMGKSGVELIVGARNDPDWGPVILAGFGGVTAEIHQDVRLLPPDLTVDAIIAELNQLKAAELLHGFRGSPALDIKAAADIISHIGGLLLANPSISEIDLNPVVLYPEGEGAVALDALIFNSPSHQ